MLAGRLLLAAPTLLDPNFRRSAILLVAHDADGALGLVLDRPSPLTVADAAPALVDLVGAQATLHVGGPVRATAIVVLARYRDPADCPRPILPGVGLLTALEAGAGDRIAAARVFAGYAGWGAGQLEAEIAAGAWLIAPARLGDVFDEAPAAVWRRALRRLGPQYLLFSTLSRKPELD